ncbi:MAG: hypothetical protein ABSD31_10885 [Candidatus Binataceae bacterium]
MCHQSVGLIARQIEAAGIPTMSMTSALDITRAVNPPRATFLNFPLGHTAGKPNEPELNRQIMIETLEGLTSMTKPGSIKMLSIQWSEDGKWNRAGAAAEGDDRLPRYDTPQYENEEDRLRAEAHAAETGEECHVCADYTGGSK